MSIWQDNNKVPTELQAQLAQYGLMRDEAKEKTSGLSGVKFFGIIDPDDDYGEYKLAVSDDISKLNKDTLNDMQLAVVAPDNESFDMLAPKDFTKKLGLNKETTLRRYLLKLLDSIP